MNEMQEAPALTEGGTGRRWKAVYTIVEGRGGKKHFVRIGIASPNRDDSWNVKLDALPVNGILHIRDAEPSEGRGERGQGSSRRPESQRESMFAAQGVL